MSQNLKFKIKFIFENHEIFEVIKKTNKDIIFIPKRKIERLNFQSLLEGYK